MRKVLRERQLFPEVEGGAETVLIATLRKGHRDPPIFFDELNDALEAPDAEENSPAPYGYRSPVTIERGTGAFSVSTSAVS
jgi:hypothetical protein